MLGTLKKLIRKFRKKSHEAYRSGSSMYHEEGSSLPQQIVYNQPTSWTTYDNSSTNSVTGISIGSSQRSEPSKDERIEAKPVDVVKEIVTETPAIMLDNLTKQIKIVQKRIRILREQSINPTDEEEALGYLKARQNYKKYHKRFEWTITTNEKVSELCRKYKLRKVGFKGYYKTVPTEALDELEKFVKVCRKVRAGDPNIELIIDDGGKETRRDPIMLAASPFGRWWYICGAWDKEVEVVGELIYNAK